MAHASARTVFVSSQTLFLPDPKHPEKMEYNRANWQSILDLLEPGEVLNVVVSGDLCGQKQLSCVRTEDRKQVEVLAHRARKRFNLCAKQSEVAFTHLAASEKEIYTLAYYAIHEQLEGILGAIEERHIPLKAIVPRTYLDYRYLQSQGNAQEPKLLIRPTKKQIYFLYVYGSLAYTRTVPLDIDAGNSDVIEEAYKTLYYYKEKSKSTLPAKVYLVNESKALVQALKTGLKLEIQRISEEALACEQAALLQKDKEAPNLAPAKSLRGLHKRQAQPWILASAAVLALACIPSVLVSSRDLYGLEREKHQLEAQIESAQRSYGGLDISKTQLANWMEETTVSKNFHAVQFLADLQGVVDGFPSLWIESMDWKQAHKQAQLTGRFEDQATLKKELPRLIEAFDEHPHTQGCPDIILSSNNPESFTLTLDLQMP